MEPAVGVQLAPKGSHKEAAIFHAPTLYCRLPDVQCMRASAGVHTECLQLPPQVVAAVCAVVKGWEAAMALPLVATPDQQPCMVCPPPPAQAGTEGVDVYERLKAEAAKASVKHPHIPLTQHT